VAAALSRRARRRGAGDFVDRLGGVEVHSGYWQDAAAVASVRPEIIDLLARIPALSAIGRSTTPYVALHARLGDYLSPTTRAFHGLTDVRAQLTLADALRQRIHVESIRLFTDSPEHVKSFLPAFERVEVAGVTGAWEALTGLGAGSAIVMSNSSLSWWAATLACWRGLDPSLVLMPKPWLAMTSDLDARLNASYWTTYDKAHSP
jgi:hypothetical protein